jgi:hypothetical protein
VRCIQHFSDPTAPPVGLWWVDPKGNLDRTYAAGHTAEETYAEQVMSQKAKGATWDQHFDALENVYPIVSGWESVYVKSTPQQYLDVVRKLVKLAS